MNSTDNLVNGHANDKPSVLDYTNFVNGAFHENDGTKSATENGVSNVLKDTLTESDDFDDPLREEVPENERTNYAQTLMNLMNGFESIF